MNEKKYHIVISTGNLDDDFLVAEIYSSSNVFIGSVYSNGKEIICDFTCIADKPVCKTARTIALPDFNESINEAMKELELEFSVTLDKKEHYIKKGWRNGIEPKG